MRTMIESIYSPIDDKGIKKNLADSPIWNAAYTKDEMDNNIQFSSIRRRWYKYEIKFKGLTPIQVNKKYKL